MPPTPHANKGLIGVTIDNSSNHGQSTIIGSAVDDLDIARVGLVVPYGTAYESTGTRYLDIDYAKNTMDVGTIVTLGLPGPSETWDDNLEEHVFPSQAEWEDFVEDWADNAGADVDYFVIGNEPNAASFWAGTYTQYKNYCNWAISKVASCNTANGTSCKVLVGTLAGYDGTFGSRSCYNWAEDLEDDCPNADGLAVHFYETNASTVISNMNTLMTSYASGFDEVWLTETNKQLWEGWANYNATDAQILSFFEEIIDDTDNWAGTLFFDYYGHSWDDPPGSSSYPRKSTCENHNSIGSDQKECFAIRGHSTLEDGIYQYLNGME